MGAEIGGDLNHRSKREEMNHTQARLASRYISSGKPRTYGYRTRVGESAYQEKAAPQGQPRGSYSGRFAPVDG